MRIFPTLAAVVIFAGLAAGCEQQGPAERAGEALDDAVGELKGGGKDLGDHIEDACEEVKEGMGAKDTNC